jgi:hypothetical protein
MSIIGWFRHRPDQFDPDRVSGEMIQWVVDKAIALTNPRLTLLPDYRKRLIPAVERLFSFLRAQIPMLPAVHDLSPKAWSSDPVLKAFFVEPSDITAVLGAADNLRTLFAESPSLDAACVVLGMAFKEEQGFGMALRGDVVQRDVAQISVSFSDHRARLCATDELRLRRVVGIEVFEYLVGQALSQIGEERIEREELLGSRSLIRARLRLLQQHGPGLGSMFGADPAAPGEQARLDAELLENERQLEAIGGGESLLASELECLQAVLGNPQRYLCFEAKRLRLNTMNVLLDEHSTDKAADIDFAVVDLKGNPPMRRAFVLARVARAELPPPKKVNFDDAARYL